MPVHVVPGRKDEPRLFVSAAVYGDEFNGVEIIRRLLRLFALKRLRGTLIAVPIVNVYGVLHNSRYLPDRRDLNRSFPGSERGSLAARLARLSMSDSVSVSTHGIDVHTGAIHRGNFPKWRRSRMTMKPNGSRAPSAYRCSSTRICGMLCMRSGKKRTALIRRLKAVSRRSPEPVCFSGPYILPARTVSLAMPSLFALSGVSFVPSPCAQPLLHVNRDG